MNDKFYKTKSSEEIKLGGKSLSNLMSEYELTYKEFEPYLPLENTNFKPEVHYLGYYHKWDPQECFYYAVQNTGFIPAPERTEGSYSKYSSLDDKIDPFHYYTTFIKFGLGRASYDAAQEIRTGKITREEGISLVRQFDHEFPAKYFTEFLDYIDISEEDFIAVVDKNRSPHLWEQKSQSWVLRKKVWND